MHPALAKINFTYTQIEVYIEPSSDFLLGLSQDQLQDFLSKTEKGIEEYHATMDQVGKLLPSLSHQEIIEGYNEGSKLLQRNISGYMCIYFDDAYIPVMIKAIENNESHTAPYFLQALANQKGKKIAPIVILALDSKSALIRRAALSVADQLSLSEAVPKIVSLTKDDDAEISFLAKEIAASLSDKKP